MQFPEDHEELTVDIATLIETLTAVDAAMSPGPLQQHDDADVYGPRFAATVWSNLGPGRGLVADFREPSVPERQQVANAKGFVTLRNALPQILRALRGGAA